MNISKAFPKFAKGATLVEILVVILITVLLVTVAVPSYVSLMASNEERSFTYSLMSALNLAKSESIKRNIQVNVCAANVTTPTTNVNCGTTLDNGWIVVAQTSPTATLIQYYNNSSSAGSITLAGPSTTSIPFKPPFGQTAGATNYVFTISPGNVPCPNTITISPSGQFVLGNTGAAGC